jgi:hypothetical protein
MDAVEGSGSSSGVSQGEKSREAEMRRLEEELRRIRREIEAAQRRAEQARTEAAIREARAREQQLRKDLDQLSAAASRFESQRPPGTPSVGEKNRLLELRDGISSAATASQSALRALDRISVVAPPVTTNRTFLDEIAAAEAETAALAAPKPSGPTYAVDPSGNLVESPVPTAPTTVAPAVPATPAAASAMPQADAIAIAGRLNEAMYKDLGTEESAIFDTLHGLSAAEVKQVAYEYEVHYNLSSPPSGPMPSGFAVESSLLYSRVRAELDENPADWTRAQALLAGDTASADAIALRTAVEKPPILRSGDEMLDLLRNAPPAERLKLIDAFASDYASTRHQVGFGVGTRYVPGTEMPQYDPDSTVLTMNVLKGTLSEMEFAEAVGLITSAKHNGNAAISSASEGSAVASRLVGLLDRTWPDTDGAIAVLQNMSADERAYLNSLAPASGGPSKLEELMQSKMTAVEFQQATAFLQGDSSSGQASALYEALNRKAYSRAGAVPNPDVAKAEQILRGLETDEQRTALLGEFESQYGVNVASMIESRVSARDRNVLLDLASGSPAVLQAQPAAGLDAAALDTSLDYRADLARRATQRIMGVDEDGVREAFAGLDAQQAQTLAAMPLDPANPGWTIGNELQQWHRAGTGRFGLELQQMLDGDASATGNVAQQIDEAQAQYVNETTGIGPAINEGLQWAFGSEARAVLDADAARLQAAENALTAPPGTSPTADADLALAYMDVGQTDYNNAKDLTTTVAKNTATTVVVIGTTVATGGTAVAAWAPILAGATTNLAVNQLNGNANSWNDNIAATLEGASNGIALPGTAVAVNGGQVVVREAVQEGGEWVVRNVPATVAREVATGTLASAGDDMLRVGSQTFVRMGDRYFAVEAAQQTLTQAVVQNAGEEVLGSVAGDLATGAVNGDLRAEDVVANALISAAVAVPFTAGLDGLGRLVPTRASEVPGSLDDAVAADALPASADAPAVMPSGQAGVDYDALPIVQDGSGDFTAPSVAAPADPILGGALSDSNLPPAVNLDDPRVAADIRRELLAAQVEVAKLELQEAASGELDAPLELLHDLDRERSIVRLNEGVLEGDLSPADYAAARARLEGPPRGEDLLASLQKDLNTLQQREAVYGSTFAPVHVVMQIDAYETAISLTRQHLAGDLSGDQLAAELRPLIINQRLLGDAQPALTLPASALEAEQQLATARESLNILELHQAAYGMEVPLEVLHGIELHQQSIDLHETFMKGDLSLPDYQAALQKLRAAPEGADLLAAYRNDLHILELREAAYGSATPVRLAMQIQDYREGIALTEQMLAGTLSREDWAAQVDRLLIVPRTPASGALPASADVVPGGAPYDSGLTPEIELALQEGMRRAGVAQLGIRSSSPESAAWHGVGGDTLSVPNAKGADTVLNPSPLLAVPDGPSVDGRPFTLVDGRPVFPSGPIDGNTGAIFPTKPEGARNLGLADAEALDIKLRAQTGLGLVDLYPQLEDVYIRDASGRIIGQQGLLGGAKPVVQKDGTVALVVSDVDLAYAMTADGRLLTNKEIEATLGPAINQSYLPGYPIVNHGAHMNAMTDPKLAGYHLGRQDYWNADTHNITADGGYRDTTPLGATFQDLYNRPDWQPTPNPGVPIAIPEPYASGALPIEASPTNAEQYAALVNSNVPWKWAAHMPDGSEISTTQRAAIKQEAMARGLIPTVNVRPGTDFLDFESAGLVIAVVDLPQDKWLVGDTEQFKWLDAQLPNGRPPGTTWHHSYIAGRMELVPFGIHNIINHKGGRSEALWSNAPR